MNTKNEKNKKWEMIENLINSRVGDNYKIIRKNPKPFMDAFAGRIDFNKLEDFEFLVPRDMDFDFVTFNEEYHDNYRNVDVVKMAKGGYYQYFRYNYYSYKIYVTKDFDREDLNKVFVIFNPRYSDIDKSFPKYIKHGEKMRETLPVVIAPLPRVLRGREIDFVSTLVEEGLRERVINVDKLEYETGINILRGRDYKLLPEEIEKLIKGETVTFYRDLPTFFGKTVRIPTSTVRLEWTEPFYIIPKYGEIKSFMHVKGFDEVKNLSPREVLDVWLEGYLSEEIIAYFQDRTDEFRKLYDEYLEKIRKMAEEEFNKDDYIAKDGDTYHLSYETCGGWEGGYVTLYIDENGNKKLISDEGETFEINYDKDIYVVYDWIDEGNVSVHPTRLGIEPIEVVEFDSIGGEELYIFDSEEFYKALINKRFEDLKKKLDSFFKILEQVKDIYIVVKEKSKGGK